jgi:DNA integrity scanning protein DisA with diadenylate cyclase activity
MSNLQKFNTILEDFDKEVTKLKSVSQAYQRLEALVAVYAEIQEKIDRSSQTLEDNSKLLKMQQENLSCLIEDKTERIRKDNKDFYREFESTVKIKLDDNKSQIKQLIENERSQIKQIFEIEFAKNINDLKQTFEREITKQTYYLLKGQKSIRIPLWIIGCLILFANIFIICKLLFIG